MGKRYYIAYGSNLNIRQMRMRCPDAEAVGTASIEGYGLLFKGSRTGAYLTIEPMVGLSVPVGVWAVTAADEAALDRYEGFPAFYYKKELRLKVRESGKKKMTEKDAFLYIMHEERELGMPNPFYVGICRQGYRDFGFDEACLASAVERSGGTGNG